MPPTSWSLLSPQRRTSAKLHLEDTHSWQWTPTHGSGHPFMAMDIGHPFMAMDIGTPIHGNGHWTPIHGNGHPLMATDTHSWQWTPTHGNGHPLMAVDTHSWQWTSTHGSGHPLMAVDTHLWQWTPTHGKKNRGKQKQTYTKLICNTLMLKRNIPNLHLTIVEAAHQCSGSGLSMVMKKRDFMLFVCITQVYYVTNFLSEHWCKGWRVSVVKLTLCAYRGERVCKHTMYQWGDMYRWHGQLHVYLCGGLWRHQLRDR